MAEYPLPVFHFQVEWGGAKLSFSEVSGLVLETQMIEYRDGLSKQFHTVKMPGIQKTSTISMKRGIFKGDNEFYTWWNTVKLNTIERRDLTISLLNEKNEPSMVWKVSSAWPTKITGPTLNANGNEVAIETIEIVHEGLTVEAA